LCCGCACIEGESNEENFGENVDGFANLIISYDYEKYVLDELNLAGRNVQDARNQNVYLADLRRSNSFAAQREINLIAMNQNNPLRRMNISNSFR
jgi:hypothetical protein